MHCMSSGYLLSVLGSFAQMAAKALADFDAAAIRRESESEANCRLSAPCWSEP